MNTNKQKDKNRRKVVCGIILFILSGIVWPFIGSYPLVNSFVDIIPALILFGVFCIVACIFKQFKIIGKPKALAYLYVTYAAIVIVATCALYAFFDMKPEFKSFFVLVSFLIAAISLPMLIRHEANKEEIRITEQTQDAKPTLTFLEKYTLFCCAIALILALFFGNSCTCIEAFKVAFAINAFSGAAAPYLDKYVG